MAMVVEAGTGFGLVAARTRAKAEHGSMGGRGLLRVGLRVRMRVQVVR